MRTLTNTTVVSNFAAVGHLDLLKQVHGRLYMPNQVYEEILDGLEEGYKFYNVIEGQIYPLAETGWIELVSLIHDEEIRIFQSLPRRLHHGEAACLAIAQHRNWAFLTDDKLAKVGAVSEHHRLGNLGHTSSGRATPALDRRPSGQASRRHDSPRIPLAL
ncbi:MAG: hypothetical protein P8189_26750 [Anaerolineae bacterium]